MQHYALSHILNAEGEKLQRIVSIATNPSELLEANESVRQLVSEVASFEDMLIAMLEGALEICCSCCSCSSSGRSDGPTGTADIILGEDLYGKMIYDYDNIEPRRARRADRYLIS